MNFSLKLNGIQTDTLAPLKQKFPFLKEEDLKCRRGEESTLVERLSSRLKMPYEEVYSLLLNLQLHQPVSPTS